jgi:hypothetical protein
VEQNGTSETRTRTRCPTPYARIRPFGKRARDPDAFVKKARKSVTKCDIKPPNPTRNVPKPHHGKGGPLSPPLGKGGWGVSEPDKRHTIHPDCPRS